MGSIAYEEQSLPWAAWDSCQILNAKKSSLAATASRDVRVVTARYSVDEESLAILCRSQHVTEAEIAKLACCIAVGAYAGVQDVCIGLRADGGERVLRCQLDPERKVARLLQEFQEIDLVANYYVGTLLDLLGSTGLFDTILDIKGPPSSSVCTNDGTRHEEISVKLQSSNKTNSSVAHVAVEVNFSEQIINVSYSSDEACATWATRFAELISQSLVDLVNSPNEQLRNLDLLPSSDALQIASWNEKDLGSYESCLHHEIHRRANEFPNSFAVCAWDGDLTYHELDTFSSRVAWKLCGLGVDVGSTVAFLFHKSKWAIVSLLGILKSGASAVALNHEYPEERSSYVLDITDASVLLIGKDLEDSLQHLCEARGITKVVVDNLHFPERAPSEPNQASTFNSLRVKPEDVAYIQFTSGSTGKPKGIMIEHRTYMANGMSQHEPYHISKKSRVLQFASHTFDAILTEVITTLLIGACICIPSEKRRLNDLAGVINDFQVDWMGLTPTLARTLKPEEVPTIKTLCTWGEAATSDMIELWADAVELKNLYGPSENSVDATTHSWSQGVRDPSHLGKAIKAVNTWIVRADNREKLAPIGAVGELAFTGPTVARGYLKLDVDSFRNHVPWLQSEKRNQRIYYSGDLTRYTSEGRLELVGRRDTQVKIRGQRIELGEIEYHINQNLSVSHGSSVVEVISPSYRPTQKILVAFLNESNDSATTSDGAPLKVASIESRARAANLETHLIKYLPTHFIPTLYLPLEYMPTNASGKANRRALKMACESLTEAELWTYSSSYTQTKTPPQTEMEIKIALIWAELLAIPKENIGRDDSWFWLGGNSILAMKLAVTAGQQGLPVTVAEVLTNPRLHQLSSLIEGKKQAVGLLPQQKEVPTYKPYSTLPKKFGDGLVSGTIAQRLGVEAEDIQDVALATGYQIENLAWSSLKTRGGTNYTTFDFSGLGVEFSRLQQAIEQLVIRHDILRTVYVVYCGTVFQVIMKRLPMEIVHCLYSKDATKTTATVVQADTFKPVDICQSLLKCWIIRGLDGMVKSLVLRASHLQYDGVSHIKLCRELGLAYTDQELLPIPSFAGYTHFAATHNEEAASAFWRQTLANSSMTSVIQHDSIPWRHVLDGQVETIIDTDIVRSDPEITIGTTIKTAWSLVLAEMSGSRDVVFGSVIWGRNTMYPGVEHVTGACISNIPVRVRLGDVMTRRQLLEQVQGQYFEAVSFESFPFKRIVNECTDWKPWERLSTLVEYENLGEDTSSFDLDDNHTFTIEEIRPPADRHDITIFSMPLGPDKTFIALDFCKGLIPELLAQKMLDRLIQQIRDLHFNIDKPVEIAAPNITGLPSIPMPLPPSPSFVSTQNDPESVAATSNLLVNDIKNSGAMPLEQVKEVVDNAWIEVLGCEPGQIAMYWSEKTPFYEVWGDLIAAYGLAKHFRDAGTDISMEQILENPDMKSQLELIFSQKQ